MVQGKGFTVALLLMSMALGVAVWVSTAGAQEAKPKAGGEKKPNILIIWGDDIGGFNVSAYNQGMMSASGCRASANSRPARSPAPSTSTG